MKKTAITLIALMTFGLCFSQINQNEKLVYAGSYNLSGLMTHLAQVSIQTDIVKTSKKAYLHSNWELTTFSKWDTYFKIRDLYESYVDPSTLRPSLYKRNIYEGGYVKSEKYIFKPDKRTIESTSKGKKGPESTKSFTIGGSTADIVSTIYKLRKIDFSKFKVGQSAAFMIVFDEKEYPVSVRYMGKETVSAGNLGQKECYKLSIAAKTNKLRGKDKNLIWLTADAKKVPALIRFSIPVGVGQLALLTAN